MNISKIFFISLVGFFSSFSCADNYYDNFYYSDYGSYDDYGDYVEYGSYNYSYIKARGSSGYSDGSGKKIGYSNYGVDIQYQLKSFPLFVRATLGYGSIDKNELPDNSSLTEIGYLIGAGLIISPTDNINLLPGFSVGQTQTELKANGSTLMVDATLYTIELDARAHVGKGLWVNAGVGSTHYDITSINGYDVSASTHGKGVKLGAEYQMDADVGMGIEHKWRTGGGESSLFVKFFY